MSFLIKKIVVLGVIVRIHHQKFDILSAKMAILIFEFWS